MKLKNYRLFEKSIEDDDMFGRPNYSSDSDDTSDESVVDDDMENLMYLIRTLFKNSGVDAELDYDGLDIIIYVTLKKTEKLISLTRAFDVVKKLKKDILPQYDSEFELWETKTGQPLLSFNFTYDEGLEDDNKPF